MIAASRGGKAKTVVQALAIGLYILPLTGLLATRPLVGDGVAVVLTVLTGLDYVYRALTLRRTSARAMAAARPPGRRLTGDQRRPHRHRGLTNRNARTGGGVTPSADARGPVGFAARRRVP